MVYGYEGYDIYKISKRGGIKEKMSGKEIKNIHACISNIYETS